MHETCARRGRLRQFLASRDRGEMVCGHILQVWEGDAVRVALGPGVLTARALGGRPAVGPCQLEIVAVGERPVLRIVSPSAGPSTGSGAVERRVDASQDRPIARVGDRLDRRA